ncbi:hypothetical protein EWM64_g2163, partial [Hericium alpestre]
MSERHPDEILGTLLMRTSTPAPSEKVLMYLEGMQQEGATASDLGRLSELAKSPRSKSSHLARSQLSRGSYQRGPQRYAEDEDDYGDEISSNVQEGERSTLGSMVQRNGVDAPGPHYVSYGSSFGNFGPLPPDSALGEVSASKAAGIPLPNSTASPSTKNRSSRAGSRASQTQKPRSTLSRSLGTERDDEPAVTAADDFLTNGASAMSSRRDAQNQRPFSPYRHAPTEQDLLHAAQSQGGRSAMSDNRARTNGSTVKRPARDVAATPTPSRPQSPSSELDEDEAEMVRDLLSRGHTHDHKTPRTSYAATSVLEPEQFSHFHDMDLCVLLHQLDDPMQHEIVKKALRKAVKTRVKKLGLKSDNETIKQYRQSFHDHDPSVHLQPNYQPSLPDEPPEWAKELMQNIILMQQRIERLGPKIDSLKTQTGSSVDDRKYRDQQYSQSEIDRYTETPMTQTVNIQTQPTGTINDESVYLPPDSDLRIVESTHGHTLPGSIHHHDGSTHGMREEDEYEDDDETQTARHGYDRPPTENGNTRLMSEYTNDRMESPGQQYLEEELYKLRVRGGGRGSQSAVSHKTWELARDDGEFEDDPDAQAAITESGMPEIPDSQPGGYGDRRATSPPLPPLPGGRGDVALQPTGQVWQQNSDYNSETPVQPPWQRIHQRLLNWAIVWPLTELDNSLNSTTRGNQVDEVALSIWSTQTYKRYVRSKMTDSPPARVDRLFVPPNMADAISNAVFNGRHGDASGMLRELWHPFGLEGMP